MTRFTLQHCQEQIAAFTARELPEDSDTIVAPARIGDANLTVLTLFWEGREANAVPREARLTFGLDQCLLWIQVIDPVLFDRALEEGFELEEVDFHATRRLASFDDLWAYLRGQRYQCTIGA